MAKARAKAKSSAASHSSSLRPTSLRKAVEREWFLGLSLATTLAFALFGGTLLSGLANPFRLAFIFLWLFGVVMASALAVARHADQVAEVLGEPYGTLVLTLSVTAIEVMSISAVMLHGENNPTLVRDTLFAIVMIILGGMVGGSLLLGGWNHSEQHYNLQSANAYLGVIIPLAVLTLTLPDFTITTPGPTLSFAQQVFLFVMSIGLYGAFLALQTGRHRGYFVSDDDPEPPKPPGDVAALARFFAARLYSAGRVCRRATGDADRLLHRNFARAGGARRHRHAGGDAEAIAATRASMANHLQRSINISLGSVLSTLGLTVPAMLAISHFTKHEVYLGLDKANDVLLLLTIAVCVVTFASGRTNVLQGAVHVMLFSAFVMLIFQG
jgi:Ca2+:H+ antiporter